MTDQTWTLDHAEARRLAAAALDDPLDGAEARTLDAHLTSCAPCRTVAAAMRRDAEALGALDLGPVPIAVRANVAIAAERRGRGGSVGRWGVILAVGALLIAGIGSGVVGGGGKTATPPGPSGAAPANAAPVQVSWKTDVAMLTAQTFSLSAGDKTFTGRTPNVKVSSDPGDATFRSLEVTWLENGVEMRLNLFFRGDATTWWVSEIRAYDGKTTPKAEWMTATGKWFQSPIGQSWSGDQDIALGGDPTGIAGTLHLGGATIATTAVDNVTEPLGGGKALGPNDRPFAAGGPLHCSGILQLAPADAEAALLQLGYRLSWRRDTTTGPNTGYAEAMPHAPDGVIAEEPAPGSHGELIMFVVPFGDPRSVPLPIPGDCPGGDPNQPTPSPKG